MEVFKTEEFVNWLALLRDRIARAKVLLRINRLEVGNPGKTRSVGAGVSEMKIDYGPGYRIYYTHHGSEIAILLCGGDKSTQQRDIGRAIELAREWKKGRPK